MRYPSALRRRSILCAALLLAALLPSTSQPARACPDMPTFGEMTEQASVVFVGKLTHQTSKAEWTEEGEEYDVPVGTLRVETPIKGDVAPGLLVTIDNYYVYLSEELDAAKPDTRTFLVFAMAGNTPAGLSLIDVRDVTSQTARETYVARTREMLDILKTADRKQRQAKSIEWSIRCMEDEVTRVDGVQDLNRSRWLYDEERDEGEQIALEPSQLGRIVSLVLKTDDFESQGSLSLAHMALGLGDIRVVEHLTTRLRAAAESSNESTRQLMYTLAYGSEWYEGGDLVAEFNPEASADERRAFVERFLTLLAERPTGESEPVEIVDDVE